MYDFSINERQLDLSVGQVAQRATQFIHLKTLTDIARFFKLEKHKFELIAGFPKYHCFYVPKPNGGKRYIQAPQKELKSLQKKIAHYLQCVYFGIKPRAAYGFIIVPRNDDDPRNILTNAMRHVGSKWVLNIDMKDFFHYITTRQVKDILTTSPFEFSEQVGGMLAELCTFEGRLPMGAPTSPVLSNLFCLSLDHELQALADQNGWIFTRYADDITISSQKELSEEDFQVIKHCLEEGGLRVNPKKVKLKHRKEKPEVTGLVLKKKGPDVSKSFIKGIESDIALVRMITSERIIVRELFIHPIIKKSIKKLKSSIKGQLAFVGYIRGRDDKTYLKLKQELAGL